MKRSGPEKEVSPSQKLASALLVGAIATHGASPMIIDAFKYPIEPTVIECGEPHDCPKPEGLNNQPKEDLFVFGGWGRGDSEELMNSIASSSNHSGLAYVDYGTKPWNIEDVVQDYIEKNNIKEISLYGESIGGWAALYVANKIAKVSDIKINQIILDSTPFSFENVRSFKQKLAIAVSMLGWQPIVPDELFENTLLRATNGSKIDELSSQTDFLRGVGATLVDEIAKRVKKGETVVSYIMPNKDDTVYISASAESFARLFPITTVLAGAEHASLADTKDMIGAVLNPN